jgi:hypothetical protein
MYKPVTNTCLLVKGWGVKGYKPVTNTCLLVKGWGLRDINQ